MKCRNRYNEDKNYVDQIENKTKKKKEKKEKKKQLKNVNLSN